MAYDSALADRVTDFLTARRVAFEIKAMMGGLCFMVDGKMCVCVKNDRLMARLDPAVAEEALSRRGCQPMEHARRRMNGFVWIEPEGHEAEAQFRSWMNLALDFNPRAKASQKRVKAR